MNKLTNHKKREFNMEVSKITAYVKSTCSTIKTNTKAAWNGVQICKNPKLNTAIKVGIVALVILCAIISPIGAITGLALGVTITLFKELCKDRSEEHYLAKIAEYQKRIDILREKPTTVTVTPAV